MQQTDIVWLLGLLAGVVGLGLLGSGFFYSMRIKARARSKADDLLADASRDAESQKKEILVSAHEKALGLQEEADRRERELEERETALDAKGRKASQAVSDAERQRKQLQRQERDLEERKQRIVETGRSAEADREEARLTLERIAGMTRDDARAELIAGIEKDARREATRLARKLEEEARERVDREAKNLLLQASQRVKIREVLESTVSFIQLPNDEMKGRIIGKEGRNIRALEMATGIDLIVDDTPRSIWISCFDPLRREIARVSIDRLLEDGRIHPARIEEVVQRVTEEIDQLVEEKGSEAAFSLGLSDLNPRLVRLVGRTRFHTTHGQNLLQHSIETALIASHLAHELGGRENVARRAGLLHEIGQVADNETEHSAFVSADLCARHQEPDEVVQAIRSLHPDVQPRSMESLLLDIANRLSENRPGARKDNLAAFIERLRRLEGIATEFPGVERAFAVKAGKELRVIVDTQRITDEEAYALSRNIARKLERELSYPGTIKVNVVRETRAVRFAV